MGPEEKGGKGEVIAMGGGEQEAVTSYQQASLASHDIVQEEDEESYIPFFYFCRHLT